MSWFSRFRMHRGRDRMSCAEVGELLQSYLDEELEPAERSAVFEHLESCRRCGLEATVYRDVKDALAHRVDPPPASVDRLRAFAERIAR